MLLNRRNTLGLTLAGLVLTLSGSVRAGEKKDIVDTAVAAGSSVVTGSTTGSGVSVGRLGSTNGSGTATGSGGGGGGNTGGGGAIAVGEFTSVSGGIPTG